MIDDFDLGSAEEYYGNVAELADAAGAELAGDRFESYRLNWRHLL